MFQIVSPNRLSPTLFKRRKHWAARFGVAPVLPMTRLEMDALGWDACDVILVTGDAYVDHPSFGMALVGRLLENQGFRVGIISQPDWQSAEPFRALGRPKVMFGVTAGNMDSMVNRYTSDRKMRSDDAYSPGGVGGLRPDRSVVVYAQRCREAFRDVPLVIGGIEASLRRIAHYDYWSDKVRRAIVLDAKADLLVYGNGERQIVEIAHRLASGEPISALTDVRGTAHVRTPGDLREGYTQIDSREVDTPGRIDPPKDPYATEEEQAAKQATSANGTDAPLVPLRRPGAPANAAASPTALAKALPDTLRDRAHTVVRMPDYDRVVEDPVLYAHASRILHLEANPGNARALVQRHGDRDVWLNPPALPLTTPEMDAVYELPYTRRPHPSYGDAHIPAYEMIKNSITIMRGCFGGCTFCSITEHEGRIIQNRSETSVLREIETVRDTVPGFTGVISDVGGPTANMYRLACKDPKVEAACRLPSCVYPGICSNLNTDHSSLVSLYRKARALPGIKKVLVASGVRYDLAATSPAYVKELAQHHVGGYLKIAPEHTEEGPLSMMLKPGIGTYDKFKELFDKYSKEAGKEQYLIPYFIAAHPGTTDQDMVSLALWLKRNGFRADQVQAFLPAPMATATAMYHTGLNPLRKLRRPRPHAEVQGRQGREGREARPSHDDAVHVPKGLAVRRLHKAFLRYHDPANWPLLREALRRMGRSELIGDGPDQLIPAEPTAHGWKADKQRAARQWAKRTDQNARRGALAGTPPHAGARSNPPPGTPKRAMPAHPQRASFRTQHTGLPPQSSSSPARSRRRPPG